MFCRLQNSWGACESRVREVLGQKTAPGASKNETVTTRARQADLEIKPT